MGLIPKIIGITEGRVGNYRVGIEAVVREHITREGVIGLESTRCCVVCACTIAVGDICAVTV
jgi:hypothetical protein